MSISVNQWLNGPFVTNKGGLNGTTRFIWGGPAPAGWQCLEELDGSDNLVARYTYAPGYIDAVAVQERDLNGDSDFAETNEVVYYHSSTLFTVLALTDVNESVVEKYRYDAYGAATVLDADGSADADGLSDVHNPYLFTARRLDVESGLMQYRHRYYNPTLGRFASRDQLRHTEERSLYSCVRGRPTLAVDPMGLKSRYKILTVFDPEAIVAHLKARISDIQAAEGWPPNAKGEAVASLEAGIAAIGPQDPILVVVSTGAEKILGTSGPDTIHCYEKLRQESVKCAASFLDDTLGLVIMAAGVTVSTAGAASGNLPVIGVGLAITAIGGIRQLYHARQVAKCAEAAIEEYLDCIG